MIAEEVKMGMRATLIAAVGGKKLEFPVCVAEKKNGIIFIKAIERDNRYVNFDGFPMHLLIEVAGEAPQIFRNVKMKLFKNKKGICMYAIKLPNKAMVLNRRESYRCYVGEKVFAQFNANKQAYEGIFKDVSSSGFSVVFDKKELPKNYTEFTTCHLVYSEYMCDTCYSANLNLTGTIVRIFENENEKVIFGCHLSHHSSAIDKYIAQKELSELRNRRQRN